MRRKRLVAAGAMGAVVLGLCAAALHPYLRGRIERMAGARLGVPVHVDTLSLGFASVTLGGVRFGGTDSGFSGAVDTVVVEPGPLSLALGGAGAVSAVSAVDVSLRASTANLRDRLHGGHASTAASASRGAHGGRALSARNIHLTLEDEHGELVQVSAGTVTLDESRALVVDDCSMELGEASGGQLVLGGVSVRADLAASPRLTRLDVGSGHVVAVPPGLLGVRTWSRLGPLLDLIRPASSNDPPTVSDLSAHGQAEADAGGAISDGAASPSVGRPDVGSSNHAPAHEPEGDAVDAGHGDVRQGPFASRISSRTFERMSSLVAGAEVSVGDFEIRIHRPGTDRVVARDLFSRFSFGSEGIHLDGHGTADTGGAMRWDLTLHPAQTRGEGSISAAELPLDLFSPLLSAVPLTHAERGRLSFNLNLQSDGEDVGIEGDLTLRNAEVSSDAVAGHPVGGLSIAVEGRATWSPALRRLSLEQTRLTLGRASVALSGMLEAPPDHYAANLVVTLLPTDCADALGAVPRDLLDDVADFTLEGRIAARVGLELDSRQLGDTQLRVHVADGCRFVSVPAIADLRRVGGPFVHRVREPDGSIFEMTTGPGTAAWTSISSISPFLVHAVVAHEDSAFFRHSGFAPWAIRDALVRDLEAGRYVTGASTITMQLAKNLFLQREKTLARKAQEVILTWWLEAARSKQEILELYLNLIEYGPGIYGIRSASEHYFGRDPVDLSAAEAAFLASILPAPKRFHAQYVAGALSHSMRNRMRRLLERMAERGRIDQAALDDGRAELEDFQFARPGRAISHPAAGGYAALSWTTDLDEASSFDDTEGADGTDGDEFIDEDADPSW